MAKGSLEQVVNPKPFTTSRERRNRPKDAIFAEFAWIFPRRHDHVEEKETHIEVNKPMWDIFHEMGVPYLTKQGSSQGPQETEKGSLKRRT